MYIALGASLSVTQGFAAPEVAQTYTYARQLCHYLEEPHQLFRVLRGLVGYHSNRAEHQTAHALCQQLLSLAQQSQDIAMLCVAHRPLGSTLFFLGTPGSAHTHFTQGIAFYDLQQCRVSAVLYGEAAGVVCRSHDALTLWYLGYPDQALARSHEAEALAQQIAHPFSLDIALGCAAIFHQLRREARAAQEHAEAATSLATEQGFPFWMAIGAILRGWSLAQQAQAKEGIEQIHQGLKAFVLQGQRYFDRIGSHSSPKPMGFKENQRKGSQY